MSKAGRAVEGTANISTDDPKNLDAVWKKDPHTDKNTYKPKPEYLSNWSSIMNDHPNKGRVDLERGCHLYSAGKIQEAFTVFQSAAKLGSLEAQVNLANLLDAGEMGEKNCKQAAYWYKKAIKNGSPEAAYNLAISYRQQGKFRWFGYWIRKAAEMGDEDALEELLRNLGENVKPTRNA